LPVLLTITTTHRPATDLGFLMFKHPGKAQSFPISAGIAHVFYPQASEDECTAALLVEIDPIALVRGRGTSLTQYVNDRPYAAGSQLAVAFARGFRHGHERPSSATSTAVTASAAHGFGSDFFSLTGWLLVASASVTSALSKLAGIRLRCFDIERTRNATAMRNRINSRKPTGEDLPKSSPWPPLSPSPGCCASTMAADVRGTTAKDGSAKIMCSPSP
jgi:hypothetical protein